MIIVKIQGGLGNQIFQYNFIKYLTEKFPNAKLRIDINSYIRNHSHGGFLLKNKSLKKRNCYNKRNFKVVTENNYNQDINPADNIIFDGYWQDFDFFPMESITFNEIFGDIKIQRNKKKYLHDIQKSKNSVSIHIRRGDYVEHFMHGNIATKSYFQNSIEYIITKISEVHFFIFSDDIQWVKKNIYFSNYDVTYIQGNNSNVKKDLFLMSQCKHNIISNSSFSWWAQQLNNNPDKIVISPEYWVNETHGTFHNNKISLQMASGILTVKNIPLCDIIPQNPFFSVILVAYNQESCIRRAISSILNQNFCDFELIIVNDGSTDNTLPVLEEYLKVNKKIRIINHSQNSSLHISRIDGVENAIGKYVLFLDGDDYFSEGAFGTLYQKIHENPDYDFYEYGYIERPFENKRFLFDLRPDRLLALFDEKNSCVSTMWNKVYNCHLLKRAFKDMERIYLNCAEDTYESIVIAYYARNIIQIDSTITNYLIGTGISTSMKDFNNSLSYITYIKKTLECVNNFIKKNELTNLNIDKLELKFFKYICNVLIKKQTIKKDRYKLFFLLPQYFNSPVIKKYFSTIEEHINHFNNGSWSLYYYGLHFLEIHIPQYLQRRIRRMFSK